MAKHVFIEEQELKELLREVVRDEMLRQKLVVDVKEHPPDDSDCYLSHKEAARFLGCCNNTLRRLRIAGKIPYSKVGRQIKINRQALIKFLKPKIL